MKDIVKKKGLYNMRIFYELDLEKFPSGAAGGEKNQIWRNKVSVLQSRTMMWAQNKNRLITNGIIMYLIYEIYVNVGRNNNADQILCEWV